MGSSASDEGSTQYQGDAKFVRKDSDSQIVTAPVLIPEQEDRHGDVIPADNVEEVAHKFLAEYQNVDLMHTLENVGVPVESYVAPTDLDFEVDGESTTVPKGSWMLSVKVQRDEVWKAVRDGDLTGFSIYGAGRELEEERV